VCVIEAAIAGQLRQEQGGLALERLGQHVVVRQAVRGSRERRDAVDGHVQRFFPGA
jgi:hypothetical protein